jgi:hypothetical protein
MFRISTANQPSLTQGVMARWLHDEMGIELGRFHRNQIPEIASQE